MGPFPSDMPVAVILAGGLGTRLRHLTSDRPKALVPVGGRPFLEWQVQSLVRGGCTRIRLAAGHRARQLAAWSQATPLRDLATLSLSVEPLPLGTGGGLRFAAEDIAADTLLVVNGDTLLPALDLPAFVQEAAHQKAAVAMAVAQVPEAERFGTIERDEHGRIVRFLEKGRHGPGWINGGFYVVRKADLDAVEFQTPWSLETDWFPRLAARGDLAGIPAAPPLLDMGTPEGLAEMERHLRAQEK